MTHIANQTPATATRYAGIRIVKLDPRTWLFEIQDEDGERWIGGPIAATKLEAMSMLDGVYRAYFT